MSPFMKNMLAATAGAALLLVSAGGRPATAGEKGYGSRPEQPARTIANIIGSPRVVVVVPPAPHAVRNADDGSWLYGWRVCALVGSEGRLGYFLMRGERVVEEVVADSDPTAPRSRTASDRCGHPEVSGSVAEDTTKKARQEHDLFF